MFPFSEDEKQQEYAKKQMMQVYGKIVFDLAGIDANKIKTLEYEKKTTQDGNHVKYRVEFTIGKEDILDLLKREINI